MSLIGIHESRQGSEIISIRIKHYIINENKSIFDIGLGPDDVVTLQKKIDKKGDKGNKNKNQELNKYMRSSANNKQTKPSFDYIPTNKTAFKQKNEEDAQIKIEKLLLFNNNNDLYSHSPGGFNLNSQAAFPAYFSELLKRSAPTHKGLFWQALFRPRINSFNSSNPNSYNDNFVSKGCYYSYNAFTHKDVVVTVDNPGGCQTMMINDKGEIESNLTNDDWKQVCLSSKLRFYRCSQPLLASFMFSKPIMTVCYYTYETPYMNSDDFEYCMDHYIHDPFSSNDDFEMSIAMALIVNCDLKYVLKFIEKYDLKFPRLLLNIIKHVAPSSRFCKMLIPILTNHMKNFSDDIDVAVIFFDIALINSRFDICASFIIPILKNSLWATPQCGVSIARFCIKNNLFEESLEFLNLACVANIKKQKMGYNSQKSQNELFGSLPRSKSLSESGQQSKSMQNFYRSTSMTLSIKKSKKEKNHQSYYDHNNHNKSNDYEYDIYNENDDESNLDLSNENNNNEYQYKSLSSSPSSRFNSPQNSLKSSCLDDRNTNYNNEDDESFLSSKQGSRINSPRRHRKSSYTEEKKSSQNFQDDFELEKSPKLASSHSSRKNSYIEDNIEKNQHHDIEYESLSSSRPSSRLGSSHSSRKNSYIEDLNIPNPKEVPNYLDSFFFEGDILDAYTNCEEFMTHPPDAPSYGPLQSSRVLFQNHFVTLKSQILFTLSELIDKLGEAEFEAKKDEFIKGRPLTDEDEIIFNDDDEIYTSYFYPPENFEEDEEEEEFISIKDENEFDKICNNSDIADNDNYDSYILSNIIDEKDQSDSKSSSIKNTEKYLLAENNNNNDNNSSNSNNNNNNNDDDIIINCKDDKNGKFRNGINNDNDNHIEISPRLRSNSVNDGTNSITIPKFRHSGVVKHDLLGSIKKFANKAKNRIIFKIQNKENESAISDGINRTQKVNIDSLPPMSLFDPGIEASFDTIPSLPIEISQSMPVSNFFLKCLSEIKKDYVESMLILAHQKDVTMSTQTIILFIALETNDKRLMEAMLNSFNEENRATGTDKLILLRGFTMNVTSNLEAILTVPLVPLTVIEKNALAFMEPFAIGIHRLNNTEL